MNLFPIYSPLVYVTILSPCWAYLLWRIKSDNRTYYLIGCPTVLAATIYLAYYPTRTEGISYYLHYYGIFGLICIMLYGFRYDFREFPKVVALTVFTLFIAGDLWEIPEFLCDAIFRHNGILNIIWLASQIRRVYTVAVAVLFQRLSGFSFNSINLAVFGAATLLSFIFLLPPDGLKLVTGWQLTILSRMVYMPSFALVGFLGVKDAQI